jgi:hypothetical protein
MRRFFAGVGRVENIIMKRQKTGNMMRADRIPETTYCSVLMNALPDP